MGRLTGILAELAGRLGLAEDLLSRQVLWAEARRLTRERSGGDAHIWAAMGLDYRPCSMGCQFCSFAEPWTAVREGFEMDAADIDQWARRFVAQGADYLVLRTSEFFAVGRLAELGRHLREFVPASVRLVANTSLLNEAEAATLHQAGFDGIYKTIRIREGVDTPFDPADRLATIALARSAGLEIYALVEPVGPEHTAAELYEAALRLRDEVKPVLIGTMARVPVPGSPLFGHGQVSNEFLADLNALLVVTLLPCLPECRLVCSHPASSLLVRAGVNAYVCEVGAVPRSTDFSAAEWSRFGPAEAVRLLEAEGYSLVTEPRGRAATS